MAQEDDDAPAPAFFVPQLTAAADSPQMTYAELAALAGRPVPADNERVYSITYVHDGEEWTSTVGETGTGERRVTVGRGANKRERVERLSDGARVLAIFAGDPYVVVTNHLPGVGVKTDWANPFYVGLSSVRHVILFPA